MTRYSGPPLVTSNPGRLALEHSHPSRGVAQLVNHPFLGLQLGTSAPYLAHAPLVGQRTHDRDHRDQQEEPVRRGQYGDIFAGPGGKPDDAEQHRHLESKQDPDAGPQPDPLVVARLALGVDRWARQWWHVIGGLLGHSSRSPRNLLTDEPGMRLAAQRSFPYAPRPRPIGKRSR